MKLRLAGIEKESVVDGPGLRYVVFTQGCPHACPGCHNPDSQTSSGGYETSITDILNSIQEIKLLSGVTFSGGEPFAQPAACAKLAKLIKKHRPELDIIAYSGYYHADLVEMAKKDPDIDDFLQSIDVLIDGPYDALKKDLDLPFRGSSNQNIIRIS